MKNNLFAFFILIIVLSCKNNGNIPNYDSFKDHDGLLYFEKPESGPIVYAVFYPYKKVGDTIDLEKIDSNIFETGIKFGFSDSKVKRFRTWE